MSVIEIGGQRRTLGGPLGLALEFSARASAGLIPLDEPRAPTRFRIWHAGNNPGDPGDNHVTPEACERIRAAYERRGVALAIDYQHATNEANAPDPANPPPMAGYAELKIEAGAGGPEVWIDPIRWSYCGRVYAVPGEVCCARHQIETGQRRYISPDWLLDSKTREPIALLRLGLVAEPGTYGIPMLAARARAERTIVNDLEIIKALLAAASAGAASQDPDIQALGASVTQAATDLAAAKGMDLSAPAGPPSEPPMAAVQPPASPPAMTGADRPMMAAAAAGAALPVRPAAPRTPVVTLADVNGAVASAMREAEERRALLEANRDALGENMIVATAGMSLATVKGVVAAARADAEKRKATEATTAAGPRGEPVKGPGDTAAEGSKVMGVVDRIKAERAKK